MAVENIKNTLQNIFRDVFEKKKLVINEKMTAKDIDEWDSIMHINLIIAIEKKFGIKFKVNELIGLKTVGDTINLIKNKLNKK